MKTLEARRGRSLAWALDKAAQLWRERRLFKRLIEHLTRRPLGAFDFGDFDRTRPVSNYFGFDRGSPVDRFYIDAFLEGAKPDIRGRVLEIGDNAYTLKYGGDRVARSDILHVDANNPKATIIGDLAQAGVLPEAAFDCVIITQTLHLIFDMPAALANLWAALAPGGVLLLTVPGVASVDRAEWRTIWYWSLTEHSLKKLAATHTESFAVTTYGNVFACCAFLQGLCVEELPTAKLEPVDEAYPLLVTLRATKELI